MKKICKLFIYFIFSITCFFISGCVLGEAASGADYEKQAYNETMSAVQKLRLSDKTVTYDGEEHSILLEGDIPNHITVSYVNNNKVNAGEYHVSAMLFDTTGICQQLPSFEATLTIKKAVLDITFDDKTFSYDGESHSIYINEELPEGVNVTYTNNDHYLEGNYQVTAYFEDITGNYIVPENITRTMSIVKDGKYHDLTIIYENNKKINKYDSLRKKRKA